MSISFFHLSSRDTWVPVILEAHACAYFTAPLAGPLDIESIMQSATHPTCTQTNGGWIVLRKPTNSTLSSVALTWRAFFSICPYTYSAFHITPPKCPSTNFSVSPFTIPSPLYVRIPSHYLLELPMLTFTLLLFSLTYRLTSEASSTLFPRRFIKLEALLGIWKIWASIWLYPRGYGGWDNTIPLESEFFSHIFRAVTDSPRWADGYPG